VLLTARFVIPCLSISVALKAECKTRLQGFALSQGFAVVVGKSSQDGTPRAEFLCIHYRTVTRNRRELEDEVKKDSEYSL
jgi:hypothetical protein